MPPDTPAFRTYLGDRIRNFRENLGMTQEAVAQQMQLHGYTSFTQPRQAEVESGAKPVSLREAWAYARIFRLTLDELVGNPKI